MDSLGEMPTVWLLCGIGGAAAVVIWSGIRLARYGDALGEHYRLSRAWIGIILLAAITSLPELVVTLSAQLAIARPAIAIGNVCGSNLFNMCIFAIIDVYEGPGALSARLGWRLLKPAMMGLLGMGIACIGLLVAVAGWAEWRSGFGWLLSATIFLLCIYAMNRIKRGDATSSDMGKAGAPGETMPPQRTAIRFALCSAVLVLAGIGLVLLCHSLIGRQLRFAGVSFTLKEGIVGMIGLAVVTSLPELVVCLAAARLGLPEMAVGNLFGSNIFNLFLLPLAHAAQPMRPFWSAALPGHCLSLAATMVLTYIIVTGIRCRSKRSVFRMGWDGLLVAAIGGSTFFAIARLGIVF